MIQSRVSSCSKGPQVICVSSNSSGKILSLELCSTKVKDKVKQRLREYKIGDTETEVIIPI